MSKREKELIEAIKDIKKVEIYRDCVIIACFTILSIAFKKWWISLFSILIMFIARVFTIEVVNNDERS